MKSSTGHVSYDKRRGAWYGRVTFTENGKRVHRRVYGANKTEAREKLDELRAEIKSKTHVKEITFAALADDFEKTRLIEARYVGEKKVAGRRELSAPKAWLARLRDHFGKYKLAKITAREIEDYKLKLIETPTYKGAQRSVAAINRELEFLRTILNHAVASGWLVKNPFAMATRKLIEKSHETKRERLLGFGEEMALIENCYRPDARNSEEGNAYLKTIIIVAVDTGLRRNELFTLMWPDIDWRHKVIQVRAINTRANRAREIPMTPRVVALLEPHKGRGLVFGGLRDIKRSFATAKRLAGVRDLRLHDLRHAFVSRAILAGVPPAVVLKASGHSTDVWKRYLNVDPSSLRSLLQPMRGQAEAEVKDYARTVMQGLRAALRFDEIEALLA